MSKKLKKCANCEQRKVTVPFYEYNLCVNCKNTRLQQFITKVARNHPELFDVKGDTISLKSN